MQEKDNTFFCVACWFAFAFCSFVYLSVCLSASISETKHYQKMSLPPYSLPHFSSPFCHPPAMVKVGVLALQGAFKEHVDMLKSINVDAFEVRTVAELEQADALILPGIYNGFGKHISVKKINRMQNPFKPHIVGGESTAMAIVAERWGLVRMT
jgi:hypothetical protein